MKSLLDIPPSVVDCSQCGSMACVGCAPKASPQAVWVCPTCHFRANRPYQVRMFVSMALVHKPIVFQYPLVDISSGGSLRPFDRRPLLIITFCSTDTSTHCIARHVLIQCLPAWNGGVREIGLSEYAEIIFTPQTLNGGTQATEVSDWLSCYPKGRVVLLFGGQVTDWAKTEGAGCSAFNPLQVRATSQLRYNNNNSESIALMG